MPDIAIGPLQAMIAPIFTGPAGVGVGVAVDVAVAVGVGPDVAVGGGVVVGVFSFSLPQATNIGTIKTRARARAMNLYHKLLFGHMVNYLPLQHR
jgi:hypothetical protein